MSIAHVAATPKSSRRHTQVLMTKKQSASRACQCDGVAAQSRPRDAHRRSADAVFRAFSDVTRLRILHLLLNGEMCVGDLVSTLRTSQPTASQHLAYLRNAGLVTYRRAGLWSFYSLSPASSTFHIKILECLRHCFSEVPELQADSRRASRLTASSRCCQTDATPCVARRSRKKAPATRSRRASSHRSSSQP